MPLTPKTEPSVQSFKGKVKPRSPDSSFGTLHETLPVPNALIVSLVVHVDTTPATCDTGIEEFFFEATEPQQLLTPIPQDFVRNGDEALAESAARAEGNDTEQLSDPVPSTMDLNNEADYDNGDVASAPSGALNAPGSNEHHEDLDAITPRINGNESSSEVNQPPIANCEYAEASHDGNVQGESTGTVFDASVFSSEFDRALGSPEKWQATGEIEEPSTPTNNPNVQPYVLPPTPVVNWDELPEVDDTSNIEPGSSAAVDPSAAANMETQNNGANISHTEAAHAGPSVPEELGDIPNLALNPSLHTQWEKTKRWANEPNLKLDLHAYDKIPGQEKSSGKRDAEMSGINGAQNESNEEEGESGNDDNAPKKRKLDSEKKDDKRD